MIINNILYITETNVHWFTGGCNFNWYDVTNVRLLVKLSYGLECAHTAAEIIIRVISADARYAWWVNCLAVQVEGIILYLHNYGAFGNVLVDILYYIFYWRFETIIIHQIAWQTRWLPFFHRQLISHIYD